MKTRIFQVLIAIICMDANSAAITYKAGGVDEQNLVLNIDGSIISGDVGEIAKVLDKYPKHEVHVNLDSSGGEIDAAMRIGRLLRARDAKVGVMSAQCLSSCILVYSGGVTRMNAAEAAREWGTGDLRSTKIGIHRFYFSALSPNETTDQISTKRNRQKDEIRTYLADMNVSLQLLDAMEAIPPERMKILTLNELHQFGLTQVDPVFDEKRVAKAAAFYKVSSLEFRRREAAAKQHCIKLEINGKKSKSTRAGALPDLVFDQSINCESDFIRSGKG